MTGVIRSIFLWFVRLIVVWMVDTVSLLGMASLLAGITIQSTPDTPAWVVAASAALVLGLINFFIRPLILILVVPFGFVAILLVGLLVNGFALMITAKLLPGFTIGNMWVAFLGGFVFSLINTVITNFMTIDDQNSFYDFIIRQRASRQPVFKLSNNPAIGVIFLEIDGLSYFHLQKALSEGYMPTVANLIRKQGYRLHRIETGLPSMTTACQAGILYGNNHDIPSFRWYDRKLKRLIVSQFDASLIDQRISQGQGLISHGSSIGNMLSGNAAKSMFVLSNLKANSREEKRQRAQDFYLLMLDPYFSLRTLVKFFSDVVLELGQYARQVISKTEPRLNRLHKGYPLLRAAVTTIYKDISAYLIILDMMRGAPVLYHTYLGYDEMAHHAGPWSKDAFRELRRVDRVIARIQNMSTKAPRPYELIILSDHGQSKGHTFLQRYGIRLDQYILEHLPSGSRIQPSAGGDDGTTGVISLMNELDNIQDLEIGGRTGRAVLRSANHLLQQEAVKKDLQPAQPDDLQVACSGNLVNIYIAKINHRLAISQVNSLYPGLIDALVKHPGVGIVVGLDDDGEIICFGKDGARNLNTGDVVGQDPLSQYTSAYASLELRSDQLRRLAAFPSAGDLIVNSPVFPDGTVAAYEELIGSHGGLGGEQTDAFLLIPADTQVPPTRNSCDFYPILKSRLNRMPAEVAVSPASRINPWAPQVLATGLCNIRTWLTIAGSAFLFNHDAYLEVARDPTMTAPALLIWLLISSLSLIYFEATWQTSLISLGLVPVAAVMTWLAGRALKSQADFTPLLRAVLFAQVSYLWLLLGTIPALAPVARFIAITALFINVWIAADAALDLRGWKTVLLPIITVGFTLFSAWALQVLFLGTAYTIESLFQAVGLR